MQGVHLRRQCRWIALVRDDVIGARAARGAIGLGREDRGNRGARESATRHGSGYLTFFIGVDHENAVYQFGKVGLDQ